MMRIKSCEFCGGRLEKRSWTLSLEGGRCPVGTYFYYSCVGCSFCFTTKEVENEPRKFSKKSS